MKRGRKLGIPKTGGRQKGTKNKRTQELLDKVAATGQQPIDFLLEVMRDPKNLTQIRLDAAKAAAPYLHARRAPEDSKGATIPPVYYIHPNLESDD